MIMNSVRWSLPVMVSVVPGGERRFDCVHDALDYLTYEWPSPRGRHRARAQQALRAALDRQISPEEAREAFVAACIEAGVLVTGRVHFGLGRRSGRAGIVANTDAIAPQPAAPPVPLPPSETRPDRVRRTAIAD